LAELVEAQAQEPPFDKLRDRWLSMVEASTAQGPLIDKLRNR